MNLRRLTPIKIARLEQNVPQIDVAFSTHISQSRLSLIETGRIAPRADEVQRIAAALGVPVERLTTPA